MHWLSTIAALLFLFRAECCRIENAESDVLLRAQQRLVRGAARLRVSEVFVASEAIANAPERTGVLILADRYPERSTTLEPADFEKAQHKKLRLYIEFPASLPGMEVSLPRVATWERVVVTSGNFGDALPKMRILGINECHFVAVLHPPAADLMLARVAGYDTAVFGLPERAAYPLLFSIPEKGLTVATTKLSSFVTGRFEP